MYREKKKIQLSNENKEKIRTDYQTTSTAQISTTSDKSHLFI